MPPENMTIRPVFRPRALIADDSRIVRATLSKHLCDLFDFSEALDGEQAWEALLRDEEIDLLITDLTMPRLNGYGLLRRMRGSRSERLRQMPVVVISGTDEDDERVEAKNAGATDLISKGMPTAELVSRLDLLAQLVLAQKRSEPGSDAASMLSPYAFQAEVENLFAQAVRHGRDFALLNLAAGPGATLHAGMAERIRQAIRQTDILACTGPAEFTIATTSLGAVAARSFAERLCAAARHALVPDDVAALEGVVCCGIAALAEPGPNRPVVLHALWAAARRRCQAGLKHGQPGPIGSAEESALDNK